MKLALDCHAISVTKGKVTVDKAEILPIAIAQQNITREQLSQRLLGHDSVLTEGIRVVAHRKPAAITCAQDNVIVWDVIDMYSDLALVALSVSKLSILDQLGHSAEEEESDLRLYVDIDVDLGPKLVARRLLGGD